MFCHQCGNKLIVNSAFCAKCGTEVNGTRVEPSTNVGEHAESTTQKKPSPFKLQKNVPTSQYGRTAIIASLVGLLFIKSVIGITFLLIGLFSGLAWILRKVREKSNGRDLPNLLLIGIVVTLGSGAAMAYASISHHTKVTTKTTPNIINVSPPIPPPSEVTSVLATVPTLDLSTPYPTSDPQPAASSDVRQVYESPASASTTSVPLPAITPLPVVTTPIPSNYYPTYFAPIPTPIPKPTCAPPDPVKIQQIKDDEAQAIDRVRHTYQQSAEQMSQIASGAGLDKWLGSTTGNNDINPDEDRTIKYIQQSYQTMLHTEEISCRTSMP